MCLISTSHSRIVSPCDPETTHFPSEGMRRTRHSRCSLQGDQTPLKATTHLGIPNLYHLPVVCSARADMLPVRRECDRRQRQYDCQRDRTPQLYLPTSTRPASRRERMQQTRPRPCSLRKDQTASQRSRSVSFSTSLRQHASHPARTHGRTRYS